MGLGGGGSVFFIIAFEASGELDAESPPAGALESVADVEVAACSADFWQPARARAKQKA